MNDIQIPTTTTDAVLQLFQAMRDVTQARDALVEVESERIRARLVLELAESNLTVQARLCMAESSGRNETERRAQADLVTSDERAGVEAARRRLASAETELVAATANLRIAEDQRRFLELVVRFAADQPAAHSNGDDRLPFWPA